MKRVVKLHAGVNGFAEDKDEARKIRIETVLPALDKNETVVIDFHDVKYSTQSFIHALLGEALKKYKDGALKRFEFKDCAPQIKSLIQLVVDYSLGGFGPQETSVKKDTKAG